MVEKIEWTRRFADQAKEIIVYLKENATESAIDKFKAHNKKVADTITGVSHFFYMKFVFYNS